MAESKKVDVKKVAQEAKKATETVKATAEKTAETVKATAEKATETVKATAEKTAAPKKTAVKKPAAKRTAKKKEVTKTAVLQFAGCDFKVEDIITNAEAAFKAENKRKAVDDIKVYIKPEERAAYYVVTSGDNEYVGRIDL